MIFGVLLTAEGEKLVPVRVSVQRSGLPQLVIQNYPGKVSSLRHTLLAVCKMIGMKLPRGKIVIDLEVPKQKTWGEEGLGAAILLALSGCKETFVCCGTLLLDGSISLPTELSGILYWRHTEPLLCGVVAQGAQRMLQGEVFQIGTAQDLLRKNFLRLKPKLAPHSSTSFSNLLPLDTFHALCLALVWAGGHSLLLFGSPGEGKSRSQAWLRALAPSLTPFEQAQHSLFTGQLSSPVAPVTVVPNTATLRSWISGRESFLRQSSFGAVWLDELPDAPAITRIRLKAWLDNTDPDLQVLGQKDWKTSFVTTMNPCPCGYWGEARCLCSSQHVAGVLRKVSWPLLDRFALQHRVTAVTGLATNTPQLSEILLLRDRVLQARTTQLLREPRLMNTQCDIWDLTGSIQAELKKWGRHIQQWSPRRQVMLAQVAQTLCDGGWVVSAPDAFGLAWQLCRGAESLRKQ